jgi:3-oxoadipate enol-lactonase
MALNHPSRLHGLVLLSTSAEAERPERRTQLHLIAMSISLWGMNRWVADQAARTFFSPAFARRAPGKVRAWRRLVRATRRRALLQSLEAIRDRPSVRDQLDTVAMPALVMGTRDDPIADPEDSAAMARGLRNADLQLLPGGGHALPMEHPSALARALKQFMNERL